MDLRYTEEELAFQREVREFFATDAPVGYPQDILAKRRRGQELSRDDLQRSERALSSRGWLAVNWPVEHGGTGWNVTEKYLFDEELERAGAPGVVPMGLLYVAPVLYTFGSPEQQRRFLPDILQCNVFWAQGYSEPGSGSDLASLECKAEISKDSEHGEHYVINGSKTWTSQAHFADWIFCLVRTSREERKQQGITFLIIDMTAPGVTVEPIITIDGGHHLDSVHFDNVRVPVANRIGEEGKGWTYAKYLLTHERTSYAHIAGKKDQMRRLREAVDALPEDVGADFRRKFDAVMLQLITLEYTTLRVLASVATGGAPGDESSILKVRSTEVAQAITELYAEAAGYYGLRKVADRSNEHWNAGDGPGGNEPEFAPPWTVTGVADYFFTRAQSIYGGTNEIQKNVVAKQVLGLD